MNTIDIHTHGIGGFDTRSSSVDDILRIAEIHGTCGVAEIVLSIYPGPTDVMRRQMELVSRAMDRQSRLKDQGSRSEDTASMGSRTQDPGPSFQARILGVHLEGPFLNPAQCGALNPACFTQPRESSLYELLEGFEHIVKLITVAPERERASAVIKAAVKKGIVVSMGHSDATYSEAEAGFRAGARGITHLFNGMRRFEHRQPGLAGFGLLNEEIYVEVIADPFHLHTKTIELIFKIKNAGRIILVSDSVKETRTASGEEAVTGESGTLQGGSMTLSESCHRLVAMCFDERIVANAATVNPRRYLGIAP